MTVNASRNLGGSIPDLVIFDFREILFRYGPNTAVTPMREMYNKDPILKTFLQRFTVKQIIEAIFVSHYDSPTDTLIWHCIENLFPEGTGDFGESIRSLEAFEAIAGLITEEVDDYIQNRFWKMGAYDHYVQYRFHEWIGLDTTIASFVRNGFDAEYLPAIMNGDVTHYR